VVDVEHDALRALAQDPTARAQCLAEEGPRVADRGRQLRAELGELRAERPGLDARYTEGLEQGVLLGEQVLDAGGQALGSQQVAEPDARAARPVRIRGPDAAAGRADASRSARLLVHEVEARGAGARSRARARRRAGSAELDRHLAAAQALDLGHEMDRIDDDCRCRSRW
jgi:hypothetical protein